MDELKLCNSCGKDRRHVLNPIGPIHKLPHEMRHFKRPRRGINDLAGQRIDYVVLYLTVIARVCLIAPHTFDRNLVKFPDNAFGNRVIFAYIFCDEIHCFLVV